MPRAMGRATPLRKKSSHITVVLSGEADETKKSSKKEKEVKVEETETKVEKTEKKITKKDKK